MGALCAHENSRMSGPSTQLGAAVTTSGLDTRKRRVEASARDRGYLRLYASRLLSQLPVLNLHHRFSSSRSYKACAPLYNNMAHCERCNRWFRADWALQQHKNDSGMHHVCDDCDLDFATALALAQHYAQSPVHPYCCGELFDDWVDLFDHYDDAHYYCTTCNKVRRVLPYP